MSSLLFRHSVTLYHCQCLCCDVLVWCLLQEDDRQPQSQPSLQDVQKNPEGAAETGAGHETVRSCCVLFLWLKLLKRMTHQYRCTLLTLLKGQVACKGGLTLSLIHI